MISSIKVCSSLFLDVFFTSVIVDINCASFLVESRLYDESMTGATSKSNPSAQKVDHKELERLQRKDYWIVVTRMKLLMDLIYVCE